MEVFGGNGYVEESPMGRLFREAPVNSIWEGSRNPDDAHLVLDQLQEVATGEPRVLDALQAVRKMTQLPPQELEQQARRFTQRLVLAAQACLMLEHASAEESAAFLSSRFDPDWGPVTGISAGTSDPAALLRAAWR